MNENQPPTEEQVPEDRDEQTPGASSGTEWLRDLSGDEQTPDWLRRMLDDDDAPSDVLPAGEPVAPPVPEEREPEPPPAPVPAAPRAPADPGRPSTDELRQWFRSTEGDSVPPADKEDMPEWLQALDATDAAQEASSAAQEAPSATEEPPVEGPEAAVESAAAESKPDLPVDEDDETPDWLRELDEAPKAAEQAEPTSESVSPAAASEGAPVPDWLASLDEAPAEAEDAGEPADAGDLPDWLKEMTQEVAGTPPEAEPPLEAVPPPDAVPPPEAVPPPDAEDAVLEEPGVPEALLPPEELAAPEEAVEQDTEPEPLPAAVSLPDFEPEPEPVQAETPLPEDKIASAAEPAAPETEPIAPEYRATDQVEAPQGPDLWLADLDQEPEDELFSPEGEDETALPDWLNEAEQEPEPEESLLGLLGEEPLAAAETPDWMQDLQAGREEAEPAQPGQQTAGSELEVETSGPLAGLAGLLSPQLMAGMPSKSEFRPAPPVPEEHHALAARVREMLNEPPTRPALPVVPSSRTVMRALGRWLIYLALIAVIVVAMFVPALHGFVVAPDTNAGQDFYATAGVLPAGSEVLLVVDYDAAHDGELTPLTRVLLWHLVSSGQRVIVVSHSPQGGAMAQDLLDSRALWANGMAPQVGEQVLNLGYLPPHPTSMQAFLADPVGGAVLWGRAEGAADTALGKEIAGFGDLDLIVLVSASQEHTRWWIEQLANSQAGSTPILAGVSASIAPTLLPYYNQPANSGLAAPRGRLAGMLVGLSGAAEYESLSGARFSPNARQNMILQGSAQMLLAAIVLVSGISLLVRGALGRKG